MEKEINDFLEYQKDRKNATENTLSAYRTDLRRWDQFLGHNGVTTPQKITETLINSYLLFLEKEGKAKSTINRSLVSIRSFLLYLMKQGRLVGDPTERIKAPKADKKPLKYLSTEQIFALLDAPDLSKERGIRDKAMLELLYATGMKVSEVATIRREDLNLRFGCVTVVEAKKTRVVPIGQVAKDAVIRYLEQACCKESQSPYLFLGRKGESITRQGVWKIIKQYAIAVGLEGELTPQIIRNSFAVHMMQNGADLNSMKELMGHVNITATQTYSRQAEGETFGTYQRTHPRAKKN